MSPISRRLLLTAPLAGAGAVALARGLGGSASAAAAGAGPVRAHRIATQSPQYDQSFAAFASSPSVAAGDRIRIQARADSVVDVGVYRIDGATNGRLGTLIAQSDRVPASGAADGSPSTWPVVSDHAVSAAWASGLYVAVVSDHRNPDRRRFAPFVVRSTEAKHRIVVGVPFATYHAYNAWGGASLYPFNSPDGVASDLPIARPFDVFDGAGFLFYGDWQLAQWLDREGYSAAFVTSYDLHRDPGCLDGANVFVSAFHDEYWSSPMRANLESFIAAGGNAMFLGANSIYWRVRFDDQTMTCHKASDRDDDPHPDITATWRSDLIGQPEHLILGSQYEDYVFPYGTGFDWTVSSADHWIYEGTGLVNGATLPGLIGYEWDRAPAELATGTRLLSHTDFTTDAGELRRHNATERVHPGGGTVINVGTTYWPRFLTGDEAFRADVHVQQMTRNMLRQLGGIDDR
jgi:hypothetical protein